MAVIMYDSTNPNDIPTSAIAVAAYVDGLYANLSAMQARFPNKPVKEITVLGTPGIQICDIESGDLSPMSGASWAKSEISRLLRPTLYTSISNQQAVINALGTLDLTALDVDWWLADWTGSPHLIPGCVATQYADPATSGGHYDLSLAQESWLGITPIPISPTIMGPKEDDLINIIESNNLRHVFVSNPTGTAVIHWWQYIIAPPGGDYAWNKEELT